MNIFETLKYGKGNINEENISSFLGYLLNPIADHTLNDIFLKKFLKLINVGTTEIDTLNNNDIEIEFEYPVSPNVESDKHKRFIDILFDTPKHTIAIENKISDNSIQKNQLIEEYNGLKNQEHKSIIFCFLTPKSAKLKETLITRDNDIFKLIYWEDIIEILKDIIKAEMYGDINPIDDYVKQTIKAFINFMTYSNKSYKTFTCENNFYRIFRFQDNSIAVEIEIDKKWQSVMRGKKKDIIKKAILENKKMTQNEFYEVPSYTTTYQWGRILFNKL